MVAPGGACVVAPGGVGMVALGGHAWLLPGGGMCGCSRGCAWLLQGGACIVALGGMHGFIRGACMVLLGGMRGFIWGACMVLFGGGMCGFFGYNEIRSMSGRYASYWNAFLFVCLSRENHELDAEKKTTEEVIEAPRLVTAQLQNQASQNTADCVRLHLLLLFDKNNRCVVNSTASSSSHALLWNIMLCNIELRKSTEVFFFFEKPLFNVILTRSSTSALKGYKVLQGLLVIVGNETFSCESLWSLNPLHLE